MASAPTTVLELLAADGPAPQHADRLALFGRFVGSRDVVSTDFAPDGSVREREGEWHFAWVLGGRAIQDVLFEAGAAPAERGTTLRAYDPAIDAWHVAWMAPGGGEFVHLLARATGEGIVLEGTASTGDRARWTFTDIAPDSFTWRGDASADDGATWRLEQEMRPPAPAPRPLSGATPGVH